MGIVYDGATEILDSIAAGTLNGLEYDPVSNTVTCHYCKGASFDGCNLVCKDPWSCWTANVNNAATVECISDRSCLKTTMEDVDDLGCVGYRSCYKAEISSSGSVDCKMKESCEYATFTSIRGEIVCDAFRSCAGTYISDSGAVECTQMMSCPHACFHGVNEVECTGVASCEHSTVEAISSAICTARKACYNAKEITANEIVCQGSKACASMPPNILHLNAGNNGTVTCGEFGVPSTMNQEDCLDVKVVGTLSCLEPFSCGWVKMGKAEVEECPVVLDDPLLP